MTGGAEPANPLVTERLILVTGEHHARGKLRHYQLFLKHLDLITHLEQIKKFDDILVTYALRRKPSLRSSSTSSTLNAMIFTPGTFLQSQELRRDRS
jgi:hypothetical protein